MSECAIECASECERKRPSRGFLNDTSASTSTSSNGYEVFVDKFKDRVNLHVLEHKWKQLSLSEKEHYNKMARVSSRRQQLKDFDRHQYNKFFN